MVFIADYFIDRKIHVQVILTPPYPAGLLKQVILYWEKLAVPLLLCRCDRKRIGCLFDIRESNYSFTCNKIKNTDLRHFPENRNPGQQLL